MKTFIFSGTTACFLDNFIKEPKKTTMIDKLVGVDWEVTMASEFPNHSICNFWRLDWFKSAKTIIHMLGFCNGQRAIKFSGPSQSLPIPKGGSLCIHFCRSSMILLDKQWETNRANPSVLQEASHHPIWKKFNSKIHSNLLLKSLWNRDAVEKDFLASIPNFLLA